MSINIFHRAKFFLRIKYSDIQCRVYKTLPMISILNQKNRYHILIYHFFRFSFNIILTPTPKYFTSGFQSSVLTSGNFWNRLSFRKDCIWELCTKILSLSLPEHSQNSWETQCWEVSIACNQLHSTCSYCECVFGSHGWNYTDVTEGSAMGVGVNMIARSTFLPVVYFLPASSCLRRQLQSLCIVCHRLKLLKQPHSLRPVWSSYIIVCTRLYMFWFFSKPSSEGQSTF
jgi:hypothetical protein